MKKYLFKEMFEMEEAYWWHRAKRRYVRTLLDRFLNKDSRKSVLDVGCGTGYFLKEISGGYRAFGLDKSTECLKYTRKRGLKNLKLIDIEKSSFPGKKFDAATALDVIEHIKDDAGAMKNINKSLKDGGVVVVAVPALRGLWTYWDEIAGHYRRYTKSDLISLLKESGFQVEFVRFTNILPFFPALFLRVIRNKLSKTPNKNVSDFIKVPLILNKILYQLMRLEAFVSYYFPAPFGLSLVAVGKKTEVHEEEVVVIKTISLYAKTGWKEFFSKIRFWDAPFAEIEKMVPKKGKIIDLGCGEGLFSNFLGVSSPEREVLGIEIDKKRLSIAPRGLENVNFRWGDATRLRFKDADTVILFHLLHHLPSFQDQNKTLKLCHEGLKKGGRLIVVEVDIKPTFKYFLSWVTDHFLVPVLFENRLYSPIYFRKKKDWEKLLKNHGFKVDSLSLEKNKPFSHIAFICTKK